ncbi:MAG: AraC family transcriptional regulator [Armatimonadota bacterium]
MYDLHQHSPDETPYLYDPVTSVDSQLAKSVASLELAGYRVQLQDFKVSTLPTGWTSGIHRHRYYEVDIILSGHGETATMPTQRIGPGTVMYHPPEFPHAWQVFPGTPCQVFSMGFTVSSALPFRFPIHWPVQLDLITEAQFWLSDARQESFGRQDRLTLRLGIVLSRVLALMVGSSTLPPAIDRMEMLDRFLCDHLDQPLALDDIAEQLCVSRRTLTRLVHAQTGGSVMQRLLTFRMIHAAELLGQSDLPLKEIAEQVGIPQVAYFCRCFRRHFDCTPIDYRRRMRTTVHR